MTDKLKIENALPFKRVLLVGKKPDRSAPILSLASALRRQGIETQFSDDALSTSTRKWLNLILRSQAVIFVQYFGAHEYFQRQLHLARLAGCTVVRWWVGTDVLNCLESEKTAKESRALDQAVDLNIAVAPHLVSELCSIGIHAEYVPSLCDLSVLEKEPPIDLPKGVLTYLPTERKDFYGLSFLVRAIERNPELKFTIVGDDSHCLRHYPNVNSLGWVEDMERIWPEIGLLLRITRHDGLPRMVLEALARSRYIIYSWPYEGCWFANSSEQVLNHLDYFKTLESPNVYGRRIARSVAGAGDRFIQAIEAKRISAFSMKRLISILNAARYQTRKELSKSSRV